MRGKYTAEKQKHLEAIFTKLICAGNAILDKWPHWADDIFWVFDLNAGCGIYDDGLLGSPILLLNILKKYTKRQCKLILFENDSDGAKTYEKLIYNLKQFRIPNRIEIHPIFGDQETNLPLFYENTKKNRFGLCYQDFSGSPNFDILAEFSRVSCYSKTDILINCNTTQIKRNRGLADNPKYDVLKETRLPTEAIKDIDKHYWQIREPLGQWQWQMILGTNWNAAPTFKRLGFREI